MEGVEGDSRRLRVNLSKLRIHRNERKEKKCGSINEMWRCGDAKLCNQLTES